MAASVTVRVRRGDLDRLGQEEVRRLRDALDAKVTELRARYFQRPLPQVEAVLQDELRRVTRGEVFDGDLRMAATAVRRGDYLVAELTAGG